MLLHRGIKVALQTLALLLTCACLTGCIIISTTGKVAATAVNTTVSVAGHTIKTTADVLTPDGNDEDKTTRKKPSKED